jgi:sugar phosphate isomerase/epimerase
MRFGIVPLEFRPAVERIVVDGVPDFSRFDIVEIVEQALKISHISVIEITLDIAYIIPNSLGPREIERLVKLKDEYGHSYTAHLPLWSVEPSTFNHHIRNASVNTIVESIELARPLEPEFFVLHSTGALASEFSRLDFPSPMQKVISAALAGFSANSVEEIISQSEIDPQRLAIENVEFPFEFTLQIAEEYGTTICFDTGHLLARFSGNENVVDFYRQHRNTISEIHLNDGSYFEKNGVKIVDDHLALGQGQLPVKPFLTQLIKDTFSGPLIFELTTEEVLESLELIKQEVPQALR